MEYFELGQEVYWMFAQLQGQTGFMQVIRISANVRLQMEGVQMERFKVGLEVY